KQVISFPELELLNGNAICCVVAMNQFQAAQPEKCVANGGEIVKLRSAVHCIGESAGCKITRKKVNVVSTQRRSSDCRLGDSRNLRATSLLNDETLKFCKCCHAHHSLLVTL